MEKWNSVDDGLPQNYERYKRDADALFLKIKRFQKELDEAVVCIEKYCKFCYYYTHDVCPLCENGSGWKWRGFEHNEACKRFCTSCKFWNVEFIICTAPDECCYSPNYDKQVWLII